MIIFFIVIANEALKCYISTQIGVRFCELGSSIELVKLWQLGLVEVAFEGVVGTQLVKIWRRVSDKSRSLSEDRGDVELDNKK